MNAESRFVPLSPYYHVSSTDKGMVDVSRPSIRNRLWGLLAGNGNGNGDGKKDLQEPNPTYPWVEDLQDHQIGETLLSYAMEAENYGTIEWWVWRHSRTYGYARNLLSALPEDTTDGDVVLDAGCGTCAFFDVMAEWCEEREIALLGLGIDITREMIEEGEKRLRVAGRGNYLDEGRISLQVVSWRSPDFVHMVRAFISRMTKEKTDKAKVVYCNSLRTHTPKAEMEEDYEKADQLTEEGALLYMGLKFADGRVYSNDDLNGRRRWFNTISSRELVEETRVAAQHGFTPVEEAFVPHHRANNPGWIVRIYKKVGVEEAMGNFDDYLKSVQQIVTMR